jgi:hypothetical protein
VTAASRPPGAPGTWDRDIHWAFNVADRRRGPRRFVPPYRWGGILVTEAAAHHPYGRSTHTAGYLTHVVAAVYLAWRGGHLTAAHARWRCGAGTTHFRLVAEPDSVVCPACVLQRVPVEGRAA